MPNGMSYMVPEISADTLADIFNSVEEIVCDKLSALEDKPQVLDSAGICSIIKQCGESGVRELKFSNLDLSFGPAEPVIEENGQRIPTAKEIAEVERKHIEEIEQDVKETDLDYMRLMDPARYEELISSGELNAGTQRTSEIS